MTAYEMRIRDWSSDVCSSDLQDCRGGSGVGAHQGLPGNIHIVYIHDRSRPDKPSPGRWKPSQTQAARQPPPLPQEFPMSAAPKATTAWSFDARPPEGGAYAPVPVEQLREMAGIELFHGRSEEHTSE